MRRTAWSIVTAAPLLASLGGCSVLHLFNDAADERQAASVVADTTPLVADCHQKFVESLHGARVSFISGPTIAHDGTIITVSLEAEPLDRAQLDPKRYSCVFDNGTLTSADPVP